MEKSDVVDPIFESGIRNVTYKVEGAEDCQGYYIKSDSEIGLVVISEWWGLNKSICTTSEILSKHGFHTIVPDIYRGKNAIDREHAGHLFGDLNFQGAVNDIVGALRYLKQVGCKKIIVTGFCMGGALTLATASSNNEMDLAIPFYGVPDQKYFPVENIKCKVQMHVGSLDDLKGFSDPEHVKQIEEKAKSSGVSFETIVWEGAKHAFMNQDSEKYCKETCTNATAKMIEFIKTNLN